MATGANPQTGFIGQHPSTYHANLDFRKSYMAPGKDYLFKAQSGQAYQSGTYEQDKPLSPVYGMDNLKPFSCYGGSCGYRGTSAAYRP